MTDGLFRETVRAVPSLPEVHGRYDGVKIEEQIVDSAVYRYELFVLSKCADLTRCVLVSSVNHSTRA